jgi:hypothetical protein
METNQDDDADPRGDEIAGERERWDKERYLAAANRYIDEHPDEWDELLEMVDPDWFEHYRSQYRAMHNYRDEVALEVAHLLEIGEL